MGAIPHRDDRSPSQIRQLRIGKALDTATELIARWLVDEAGRACTELAVRVREPFAEARRRERPGSVAAVATAISGRDWSASIAADPKPPGVARTGLPDEAIVFCERALRLLAIPDALLEPYLRRLVGEVFDALRLRGQRSTGSTQAEALDEARDLLAGRLAWDVELLREYAASGAELAWRRAVTQAVRCASGDGTSEPVRPCPVAGLEVGHTGTQRRVFEALRRCSSPATRGDVPAEDPDYCESPAHRPMAMDAPYSRFPAAWVAAPAVLLQRLAGLSACERHDYDWSRDRGFRDLEALMTGPLVDTAAAGVRGGAEGGRAGGSAAGR